jgi:hypothetical protein
VREEKRHPASGAEGHSHIVVLQMTDLYVPATEGQPAAMFFKGAVAGGQDGQSGGGDRESIAVYSVRTIVDRMIKVAERINKLTLLEKG